MKRLPQKMSILLDHEITTMHDGYSDGWKAGFEYWFQDTWYRVA